MDPDRRTFIGNALAVLCAGYNLLFTQTVERLYKFLGFAQPKPKRGLVPLRKDRLVEFHWQKLIAFTNIEQLIGAESGTYEVETFFGYLVTLKGELGGLLILRTHPMYKSEPTKEHREGWLTELIKLHQRKSLANAADLLALYGFEATTIEQGRYPDEETTNG